MSFKDRQYIPVFKHLFFSNQFPVKECVCVAEMEAICFKDRNSGENEKNQSLEASSCMEPSHSIQKSSMILTS